ILRPLIGPVCVTKSIPVLSSFIEGDKPLDFYVGKTDRLAIVIIVCFVFGFAVIDPLKRLLHSFFQEKDSAYNLAVFRIVFFLFVLLRYDKEKILWFSQLPKELMFPPLGMKTFLSIVPVNAQMAGPMYDLFAVSCIFAMVGLWPRISCWLAAILGIYVLGIPQFFGKTDHYHHLIWFMMILGTSPCADVLSVPAFIKSLRQQSQISPERSRQYAIPLRLIWILMGIIYYFPGFWKFAKSQWHWFLSNNLQYQMYAKWFELSGWTPVFRIDQHPWLCQLVGGATIIFELLFIVVILIPSIRWLAVVSGLLFHNLTNAFMGILFLPLQICYVSFIDWERVFGWLKSRIVGPQDIVRKMEKTNSSTATAVSLKGITVVGTLLIGLSTFFGLTHQIKAWPFACYPTFAGSLERPEIQAITFVGVRNGQEEPIDVQNVKVWMAPQRYAGLIERILSHKNQERRFQRLQKFMASMKGLGVDISSYQSVRFYKSLRSTIPEKYKEEALSQELLCEVKL
ncbi:MAG: HTTM domain-containing protein, partial [Candidatus Omnitrophica bacterium]|nr:HTTM domain-containing protein [Candidatus Omnitrophota bacterium]